MVSPAEETHSQGAGGVSCQRAAAFSSQAVRMSLSLERKLDSPKGSWAIPACSVDLSPLSLDSGSWDKNYTWYMPRSCAGRALLSQGRWLYCCVCFLDFRLPVCIHCFSSLPVLGVFPNLSSICQVPSKLLPQLALTFLGSLSLCISVVIRSY